MMLCVSFLFVLCGCKPSYNYSTINTDNYAKAHEYKEIPEAPSFTINKQTIYELTETTIKEDVVYISSATLTNYIVEDLDSYTLFFTTPSIVTINNTLKNLSKPAIISTASYLGVVLNASIFSNIDSPINFPQIEAQEENAATPSVEQTLYDSVLHANSLDIYSKDTRITELSGSIITAQTVNFASGKLNISSKNTAIKTHTLNFYGGSLSILDTPTAVDAKLVNVYGGKLNIAHCDVGINCLDFNIFNGYLTINTQNTAIFAKNLIKNDGFMVVISLHGIISDNLKITGGYLHCNCNFTGLKISNSLNINGGTNVIVATNLNRMAIEAETATFNISGGITIQNSTFVCVPNNNYLCFNVKSSDLFSLTGGYNNLCYVPSVTGTLMIGSANNYTLYSTSGNLVNYKDNFFGLLSSVKINSNQVKSINAKKTRNYGGIVIYSNNSYSNGQLF